MHFRLSLLCLILISTTGLPAHQPPPASIDQVPIFRISADLVTIDAVVTDGDGRQVTDLTAADFEVTVAGKKQELQQAVYIRSADQPHVLAAAKSAARAPDAAPAALSEASLALKRTGVQPDRIARTIALVVDDLGLSFRGTVDTRTVLHKYIDTQMEAGDLVAIVRTGGGTGSLQQFTTDKRLLHKAADAVRWSPSSGALVTSFVAMEPTGLVGSVDESDVGKLRDAIASVGSLGALEYIARGIAELPGRKCIVFMSEGFTELFYDRRESGRLWQHMSRMLAQVNAAGVVVYTMDARGLMTGGLTAEDNPQPQSRPFVSGTDAGGLMTENDPPRPETGNIDARDGATIVRNAARARMNALFDSQESLRFIADQTGGLAITNTNDLNGSLRRVLDDQAGYYLLGYAAPSDAPRSGWVQNRVTVRVKQPGLHVRARQGFFGPANLAAPKGSGFDSLTNAALSPFSSTGITARLTSMFGHDGERSAYVRSLLFIDTNDLRFDEAQPGRHTAAFELTLLAIGDTGRVLAQSRRLANVVLNDQQFQRTKQRGIVYSAQTKLEEPGGYQMRAAVRDVNTGFIGSASQFLELPKVGSDKLALSGVLLKGLDNANVIATTAGSDAADGLTEAVLLDPEVRVFEPGAEAVYAYEIYDGLDPDKSSRLEMGTALLHDGSIVYQSPFSPVTGPARGKKKVRAIQVAGKLGLGKDMPAGPYTLEVIVRRADSKKFTRRQWVDFEIRRGF